MSTRRTSLAWLVILVGTVFQAAGYACVDGKSPYAARQAIIRATRDSSVWAARIQENDRKYQVYLVPLCRAAARKDRRLLTRCVAEHPDDPLVRALGVYLRYQIDGDRREFVRDFPRGRAQVLAIWDLSEIRACFTDHEARYGDGSPPEGNQPVVTPFAYLAALDAAAAADPEAVDLLSETARYADGSYAELLSGYRETLVYQQSERLARWWPRLRTTGDLVWFARNLPDDERQKLVSRLQSRGDRGTPGYQALMWAAHHPQSHGEQLP